VLQVIKPEQLIIYCVRKIIGKCYQGDKIKEDKVGGACGMHGEKRNACRVLLENLKGRGSFKGSRHKLEDIIEISLQGIRWEGTNWIYVAEVRNKYRSLVTW
jgi:hypothetical protein